MEHITLNGALPLSLLRRLLAPRNDKKDFFRPRRTGEIATPRCHGARNDKGGGFEIPTAAAAASQ